MRAVADEKSHLQASVHPGSLVLRSLLLLAHDASLVNRRLPPRDEQQDSKLL